MVTQSCVGIVTAWYEVLEANISSSRYCLVCGLLNRSSVLYDAPDIDIPDDSEGEPSTIDPSVHSQSTNSFSSTDTSFHSIGSPEASFSPK